MDLIDELKSSVENDIYLRCVSALLSTNRPAHLPEELGNRLDALNKDIWVEVVKLEKRLIKLEYVM